MRKKSKLKQIKHWLRRPFEWLGIGLALLVLSRVSHKTLFRLCDFAAWVGYHCDRAGRQLSRDNLRLVMGRAMSPRREQTIIRRNYRNMMRTLGHVFWTSRHSNERAASVATLAPNCRDYLHTHTPCITVSAHMGCWEVLSQLVHLEGLPMTSVAKDIGTPAMTRLLMKSRSTIGQTIVPAQGAFRPLLNALKSGGCIGLLVDQVVKPRDGGVWVRLFGQPIPVSVAPAFLCAKSHAPIIVAWSRPLKDGTYRCEYITDIEWRQGLDIWATTQQIILAIEQVIRRHPDCWVMNYRYFRKQPKDKDLQQLLEREKKFRAE